LLSYCHASARLGLRSAFSAQGSRCLLLTRVTSYGSFLSPLRARSSCRSIMASGSLATGRYLKCLAVKSGLVRPGLGGSSTSTTLTSFLSNLSGLVNSLERVEGVGPEFCIASSPPSKRRTTRAGSQGAS